MTIVYYIEIFTVSIIIDRFMKMQRIKAKYYYKISNDIILFAPPLKDAKNRKKENISRKWL